MTLTVRRAWRKIGYTVGYLLIDGERICETLEPTDMGLTKEMPLGDILDIKAQGLTAIPAGRYRISMDTVSSKFRGRVWAKPYGGRLPTVEGVPGFERILIHVGNSVRDTQGCLLVGRNTVRGGLTESTAAFHEVMRRLLDAHHRGETIIITYER